MEILLRRLRPESCEIRRDHVADDDFGAGGLGIVLDAAIARRAAAGEPEQDKEPKTGKEKYSDKKSKDDD